MEVTARWESELSEELQAFAQLPRAQIDLAYGIIAGALLWPVRQHVGSDELRAALSRILGGTDPQTTLGTIQELSRIEDRLSGAKRLSQEAADSPLLRKELDQLLSHFRDQWLAQQLLVPAASIDISGTVEGANVVIGGVQYVAGDFIVSQTVVRKQVRSCPSAPNPPAHFTGRENELDQLKTALSSGKNVAITGIQGMGGIGKTALALQLAHEMDGLGAVLWASLGPDANPASHLLNWAQHVDPDFELGSSNHDVLATRVKALLTELVQDQCPGTTLMILDDVWEGSSVQAARVLQRAAPPNAACLITTRSQRVVAQLRSAALELNPMAPEDAVEMLRRLLSSYPAIGADELLQLAEVVGFHPLAMELAAGQVSFLERPESEIQDLIEKYKGGLPEGSPFHEIDLELGDDREDNLEVVLSFSYQALDEASRRCFRSLGVFAYGSPFDRSLCEAIWETEPREVLDALRHRSLIAVDEQVGWYVQHPLLRAYGRALLRTGDAAEHLSVQGKYQQQVVGITNEFRTLPSSDWQHLDTYVPHVEEVGSILVGIAQQALSMSMPPQEQLHQSLAFALNVRPLLSARREIEHVEWMEMGLSISQRVTEFRYAVSFLNAIGEDYAFRGQHTQAVKQTHKAYEIAKRANDKFAMAEVQTALGLLYLLSDPNEAPECFREAASIYRSNQELAKSLKALMYLADWHGIRAHGFEKRQEGVALLQKVLKEAEELGLELEQAEAKLRLGRLLEPLGEAAIASQLLKDVVPVFVEGQLRASEGLARLFLASALASESCFEEAEEQLEKSVPLFKTTGDSTGLGVALRNLAQLKGYEGECEEALESFGNAVRALSIPTEHFMDEDAEEHGVSPSFFDAHYEEFAKSQFVGEFRRRGLERIQGLEGRTAGSAIHFSDDICKYLLTQTIQSRRGFAENAARWSEALSHFAQQLATLGEEFEADVGFVRALREITNAGSTSLSEENPYHTYFPALQTRIATQGQPLFPEEEVTRQIQCTLAVLLHQPEHRQEWTTELRRLRNSTRFFGDHHEEELIASFQAILHSRVTKLPQENPYHSAIAVALERLAEFQTLPLDCLVENTVAVGIGAVAEPENWFHFLRVSQRTAARYAAREEVAFIRSLMELLQEGDSQLPDSNRYSEDLKRAKEAIHQKESIFSPLPVGELSFHFQQILTAKTGEPKSIDWVERQIRLEIDQAQRQGRALDVSLFTALLCLLQDEPIDVSLHPAYQRFWGQLSKAIADKTPESHPLQTIPEEQIEELISRVGDALTNVPESLSSTVDSLRDYCSKLTGRDSSWDNERLFLDGLLAMLEGESSVSLPRDNPYAPTVAQLQVECSSYQELQAAGAKLHPKTLRGLLSKTAELSEGLMKFVSSTMEASKDGGGLADAMSGIHGRVMQQADWEHELASLREEFSQEKGDWNHEIQLINALIEVNDRQQTSLPQNNPYSSAFEKMLQKIDYSPGMRDDNNSVRALANTQEEFLEHFKKEFSGKNWFLEQLDHLLLGVLLARTLRCEALPHISSNLENAHQTLSDPNRKAAGGDLQSEIDLIAALQKALSGSPGGVPETNPYYLHFSRTLEGVQIFHGQIQRPGALTGEQIEALHMQVAGAASIFKEHQPQAKDGLASARMYLEEQSPSDLDAIAFLNAMEIVLEGRSTDLPIENPYRGFLQATMAQAEALRSSKSNDA